MADTETVLTAEDNTEPAVEAANDQATEPVEVAAEDHAQEQAESMFDGKSSTDSDDAANNAETEEQTAKSDTESDEKQDAPGDYDAFTLPEGIEMNDAALDQFRQLAKAAGLDQENAQKFVDLYTAAIVEAAESQQKLWADTQQNWVDQAKTDPEIGGDNFDANIGEAKRVLKEFGSPELDDALSLTGAGNHPEFIRLMSRVGKAISEDAMIPGRATTGPRTAETILYPEMAQE